jgi:hypothetical protein
MSRAAKIARTRVFPNARHDDQVDSTSQALRWLTDKVDGTPRPRPNRPRPPGAQRRP